MRVKNCHPNSMYPLGHDIGDSLYLWPLFHLPPSMGLFQGMSSPWYLHFPHTGDPGGQSLRLALEVQGFSHGEVLGAGSSDLAQTVLLLPPLRGKSP